jgi:ubiquinone biosynthesis protein
MVDLEAFLMKFFTFTKFMRQILRKKPADIDWIQKQGLLAVKLAQIFALRPDLIGEEKCQQLQQLYQHATSIPSENLHKTIAEKAPKNFMTYFSSIDEKPLAAASVGQVHRAKLKTGEEVVIKFIKSANAITFENEVNNMKRWLKTLLIFSPKLRKVGNPIALLNHVSDYTLKELDLTNEIKGANELKKIKSDISERFSMDLLRFPEYYEELSNKDILVSEYIEGKSLEEGINNNSLSWEKLLELFRIHGAFLFGIGTFHGDLHPGNCIIDTDGKFVFIDNGAICYAPKHVNRTLFSFFEHLSKQEMDEAFNALLGMTEYDLKGKRLKKYLKEMAKIYDGFESKPVGEQSLTRIMMKTVKTAVNIAKAEFGEEAFPIIRALMYLDGLVIRTHPEIVLIKSMGPYLEEFKTSLIL